MGTSIFKSARALCRRLTGFHHEQDGYAMTLTAVSLPVIVGVAAFVIDGARVSNLHTDLQHAVDSMALAGARELDGRDDAIERAMAAMEALDSNQAWFSGPQSSSKLGAKVTVAYRGQEGAVSDVTVSFLGDIPSHDDELIRNGACQTTTKNNSDCTVKGSDLAEKSNNAGYVRVVAVPRPITMIFPLPGLGKETLAVTAEAVAKYEAVACDQTPIFICNPFENAPGNTLANGLSFNENFAAGNLYGRQIILDYSPEARTRPGGCGYTRTRVRTQDNLFEAVATGASGTCYKQSAVKVLLTDDPEPITVGLNTRFGIYSDRFGARDRSWRYRPDRNVRKGQRRRRGGRRGGGGDYGGGGDDELPICDVYEPETNEEYYEALAFPRGRGLRSPGRGWVSEDREWDIERYWDINHGRYRNAPRRQGYQAPDLPVNIPRSFRNLPGFSPPSRYDTYRYEIRNRYTEEEAPNGETGAPQCQPPEVEAEEGRRVIFAAVINCEEFENLLQGDSATVPAEAFATLFLTEPARRIDDEDQLPVEIVDVSGQGGQGTVEELLRQESELVR